MNTRVALFLLAAVDFAALTVWAIYTQGLVEIFSSLSSSPGGILAMVDLCIALAIVIGWMWSDAKAAGRNAWPYIAITLTTGSLGPLLYLARRAWSPEEATVLKGASATR